MITIVVVEGVNFPQKTARIQIRKEFDKNWSKMYK